MKHEFTIEFGDFSIQQYHGFSDRVWVRGSFHHLTSEQFDALTNAFDVTDEVKNLTTKNDGYGAGRDFRTAEINLGGLTTAIFTDVVPVPLTTE
jgi:hypothetical protein